MVKTKERKYNYQEHLEACKWAMFPNGTVPEDRIVIAMVAYERWLNNRELMPETPPASKGKKV